MKRVFCCSDWCGLGGLCAIILCRSIYEEVILLVYINLATEGRFVETYIEIVVCFGGIISVFEEYGFENNGLEIKNFCS